jgi:hypothetical protein
MYHICLVIYVSVSFTRDGKRGTRELTELVSAPLRFAADRCPTKKWGSAMTLHKPETPIITPYYCRIFQAGMIVIEDMNYQY